PGPEGSALARRKGPDGRLRPLLSERVGDRSRLPDDDRPRLPHALTPGGRGDAARRRPGNLGDGLAGPPRGFTAGTGRGGRPPAVAGRPGRVPRRRRLVLPAGPPAI